MVMSPTPSEDRGSEVAVQTEILHRIPNIFEYMNISRACTYVSVLSYKFMKQINTGQNWSWWGLRILIPHFDIIPSGGQDYSLSCVVVCAMIVAVNMKHCQKGITLPDIGRFNQINELKTRWNSPQAMKALSLSHNHSSYCKSNGHKY